MSDIAELRRHAERGHGIGYKQLTELLDRLELAEADVQEHNRTYVRLKQLERRLAEQCDAYRTLDEHLSSRLEQYEKALREAQAELTRGTFTSQLRALDIIDQAFAQADSAKEVEE